ncbi:MAG: hypothetical protein QME64_08110 [bacterium]|nr:hypothetical protein [bacterium]
MKFCLILSFIMLFFGIFSRALGYGTNRGAPWLLGITPDAFLRFANTLIFYAIAFGILNIITRLHRL